MFSLAAGGCGGPSDSSTKADSFQSGGLGLTLAEWERRYNLSPIETPDPWAQHVRYAEREYSLALWYDGSPNQNITDAVIYAIGFRSQSDTPEEQLIEARAFLPADAEFQETKLSGITHVDYHTRYHSRSLAARYPPLPSVPDPWKGRVPGMISVRYGWGTTGLSTILQEPPERRAPTETPEPPPTNTPFILLPTPLPTEPEPPMPVPSGVPTEPLPPLP